MTCDVYIFSYGSWIFWLDTLNLWALIFIKCHLTRDNNKLRHWIENSSKCGIVDGISLSMKPVRCAFRIVSIVKFTSFVNIFQFKLIRNYCDIQLNAQLRIFSMMNVDLQFAELIHVLFEIGKYPPQTKSSFICEIVSMHVWQMTHLVDKFGFKIAIMWIEP